MIDSKYDWELNDTINDQNEVKQLANELSLSPIIVNLLFNRGYHDADSINQFLNPDPANLGDPFAIHDMEIGIERITQAIENNEQITVYGDYDADGLTSTAIMYETLTEIGANVNYYIPNRFDDGYGPNVDAFERIINDGTTLIVTVDNGVTGFDAVDFANQHNCDVVITDHHEIAERGVPDACAVIHARYPDDEYSFGYLSGAGIAFKVATALLDEIPQECLDLVTIGTIADLVSLTGENRILTKFGFQAIQNTERPGLKDLLENANLTGKPINEHSIGFGIGPRLNALGRMGDANVGVELLTTIDDAKAKQLADSTEQLNHDRRKLVSDIFKEASEQAETPKNRAKNTLIVMGTNWHEGVVGIVASRLVDKYHKPSIVLDLNPETGVAKGSGRSIEGFNIFKAIEPARDYMEKFGGHDMAIGLSVAKDQVPQVAEMLEANFHRPAKQTTNKPKLSVDALISVDQIDNQLYEGLSKMAPFGTDNLQPHFEVHPEMVTNAQTMGSKKTHLRFIMKGTKRRLNAVAFGMANDIETIHNMPNAIQLVGCVEMNSWNNRQSLQFMVKDVRSDGTEIVDFRTDSINASMFQEDGTYVVFHRKLLDKLRPYISEKSNIIWYNDLSTEMLSNVVTIVDCPDTMDDLKQITPLLSNCKVVLYLFKPHFVHISGLPTRTQFGMLFKLLSSQPQVQINQNLNQLAQRLNVDRNLIIFMVKVFQELNFVSINEGILTMVDNPKKQDLMSSNAYHKRQLQLQSEQQLLLSNSADLVELFNDLIG
ncbi:single-stranded-DNA-specific exonuclease RecJ [Nicoliella lavandulae]|uniref:Single-stranded-DNA-specific exonuclease RecJ n=1 Tax=Nicoliella lavandulae TaxID=3082954 RepID=A0ABU8SLF1_9LACO